MFTKQLRPFTIVWFGQLISLLGTAMTRFALLIWVFQQSGSATDVAMLGFFSFIPLVLVTPIAGIWADRLDRRWLMIAADLGAGSMTLIIFALLLTGNLQLWHLFAAELIAGISESFQSPAYSAAITMLAPKTHYAQAAGMRSLADNIAKVGAPVLASLLIGFIRLEGIILIDIATFLFAVGALLAIRIPSPPQMDDDSGYLDSGWKALSFGFRYIKSRPGLMGLTMLFTGINFFAALTYFAILPAMILARSGQNEIALAAVQAALGLGGIVGGLIISAWGIPIKKIHAICLGGAVSFLLGDFMLAIGRSTPVWAFAGFISYLLVPFITGADSAIWQAKIPPDIQGRVFSANFTMRLALMPIGYLIAGPVADRLFEPALTVGGELSGSVGKLVGVGAGAGMGAMFLITAVCGCLMSLSGYLFPAIRNVESALPDHGFDIMG